MKQPKKAYVVMEIAWQYNDEFYYTEGDDAGHVQRVFIGEDAKAKAEAFALEKNIAALKDVAEELESYSDEGIAGILANGVTEEQFVALLEDLGGHDPENRVVNGWFPENLTDKGAALILKAITPRWFDIEEVEAA